jgi:hypothetical protein
MLFKVFFSWIVRNIFFRFPFKPPPRAQIFIHKTFAHFDRSPPPVAILFEKFSFLLPTRRPLTNFFSHVSLQLMTCCAMPNCIHRTSDTATVLLSESSPCWQQIFVSLGELDERGFNVSIANLFVFQVPEPIKMVFSHSKLPHSRRKVRFV